MGDTAGQGVLDRAGKMPFLQPQWLLQDSGGELPWRLSARIVALANQRSNPHD
jgi:hypothetical protein